MTSRSNNMPTLIVASIGCAMTVLDTNVVAMVLPGIASDLGASFAELEWVVGAYVLCFASLLLPTGAIADRFGHKRLFLWGIAAFAASSILCGAATTPLLLSAARAFQGVGAAFLLAPALAIIGHKFHDAGERDRAWAFWGGMMGLTMVLSPLAGGMIAAFAGWRWAFYINLPICLALAVAAARLLPETRNESAPRLDPPGILLFAAAMFGIIWALIHGQAHGWTATGTMARFAWGLAALAMFIFVEIWSRAPMLNLALFRARRFVGAVLAMFAYAAAAQVMASLLPLLLQNGFALKPLHAGVAMLPFAFAMLLFPQVGRLFSRRLSGHQILSLGLAVVAAGNVFAAFAAHKLHLPFLLAAMFVTGAGGGLLNGETQKAIMGAVVPERAGMASGISTTTRFSGILLGFTILAGVLATTTRSLLTPQGVSASIADTIVAGDLPGAIASAPAALRLSLEPLARQAYASGFSLSLSAAGLMAAAASIFVLTLMRPRRDADRMAATPSP
jgi:EmrB/QacA subfamily drug resistance transporter